MTININKTIKTSFNRSFVTAKVLFIYSDISKICGFRVAEPMTSPIQCNFGAQFGTKMYCFFVIIMLCFIYLFTFYSAVCDSKTLTPLHKSYEKTKFVPKWRFHLISLKPIQSVNR